MAKRFTVKRGGHYRARIHLSGMETWASNAYIAAEFVKAGFSDVVVTGGGAVRYANGFWRRASQTASIPSQVVDVTVLSEPVDRNVIFGPWRDYR